MQDTGYGQNCSAACKENSFHIPNLESRIPNQEF